MWRTDSLEKTLMLGKIEGRRRRGQQRIEMVGCHHQFTGHEFEQGSWWWTGRPGVLQSMGSQRVTVSARESFFNSVETHYNPSTKKISYNHDLDFFVLSLSLNHLFQFFLDANLSFLLLRACLSFVYLAENLFEIRHLSPFSLYLS